MSFNPNKLTFKTDGITGQIIQPQIFLCDRQLNIIGEIDPVNDLRIKCVLNGADEISFSINKQAGRLYDKLKDYSVILAKGFGYFEVSPTVNDTDTLSKNVQGNSLGESELSQLFCTLECNTEDDIAREDYVATILYNGENPKASLIHRVLSDHAPNYAVGEVDETIQNIQRTFSFKNMDIISCFSEIAEEIGCIFDPIVRKNDDGTVERLINIYDAQHCGTCKSRNIINGVCQDCGSTNISGIGSDTTITIGTDHLSDEITLSPDGSIKNCFIVEGGDDMITSTVAGIQPSGNNKIYMFSPETISSFSDELKDRYDQYIKQYNSYKDRYAKTLELSYGVFDLILYLQSERMPTVETDNRTLHEEVNHIISQYQSYFPNGLGLIDEKDTTSKNGLIRQVFALFVDSGYAVKQENGNYDATNKRWTGNLIVYQLGNNDAKATIRVSEDSSQIEYSDSDEKKTCDLSIRFHKDFDTYVKQKVSVAQKSYEYLENQSANAPKPWQKYSLNRLYSFQSGYETCIETLEEIMMESDLAGVQSTAETIKKDYELQISKISEYIKMLSDMIYYLYSYYGDFDPGTSSAPSSQDVNYNDHKPSVFLSADSSFENMIHYIRYGTRVDGSEDEITDHPLYCEDCGSTNVTLNGCNQYQCKGGNVATYATIAEAIYEDYKSNRQNLTAQRKQILDKNNLRNFLCEKPYDDGTLYKELCSYIREESYTNSNFISVSNKESNSSLIRKAKELLEKANQELAKACVPQHTLSGNVHAFVAYSDLDPKDFPISGAYDEFKLGNFIRYFSDDGKMYKLRLASEEFSWGDSAELNVTFTDVIENSDGGISDIASLMQTVGNLSTSFNAVTKQAEQGAEANNTFQAIKSEGLQSTLKNVMNARDIDVQIDDKGITLRKYDYELDDYSEYQMKLINRNIVMTKDNWRSAELAIGLGKYKDELRYGVWADMLVGNLIAGEKLIIQNGDTAESSSVVIDGKGIAIRNGYLNIAGTSNTGKSTQVIIDPKKHTDTDYIFAVKHGDTYTIGIKPDGTAKFEGTVYATDGEFRGTVYATGGEFNGSISVGDGNFQVTKVGEVIAKWGMIAGWKITDRQIFTQNTDEKAETNEELYLDATDCHMTSRYNYVYNYSDAAGIPMFFDEYKYTSINKGNMLCHWRSKEKGSTNDDYRFRYTMTVNADNGIVYNDDLEEKTVFRLGRRFELNCDFYYKGTELRHSISRVTTGENTVTGDGQRHVHEIYFGVTYDIEPLINVVPFSNNSAVAEGICIDKFIKGDLGGYIGFQYSAYYPNTQFNYVTQWFAVGNLRL